jgi:hypothetical protein
MQSGFRIGPQAQLHNYFIGNDCIARPEANNAGHPDRRTYWAKSLPTFAQL